MSDFLVQKRKKHAMNESADDNPTTENSLAPPFSPPKDADVDADADSGDPLASILSLKLKKPKRWKWELTTSRSCSNIAMPRVMLYDYKGDLLVDANKQQEQVFKQPPEAQERARSSRKPKRVAANRAATANLETATKKTLEREFADLQIAMEEESPSPEPATWPKLPARPALIATRDHPPLYNIGRRANSCKEVRFKGGDHHNKYPATNTPPSSITTTPTATATTSSSATGREKRRYRRSQSSLGRSPAASESILERQSLNRGRFSSPESYDYEVQQKPRYFLRTSKAGTLVVLADSFSRYQRSRKSRRSYTEHQLSEATSTKSRSVSSLKLSQMNGHMETPPQAPDVKLQQPSNRQARPDSRSPSQTKSYPTRRNRSAATLKRRQASLSSSSETGRPSGICDNERSTEDHDRDFNKLLRRCSQFRRSKKGLVSINPNNGILVDASEKETAR